MSLSVACAVPGKRLCSSKRLVVIDTDYSAVSQRSLAVVAVGSEYITPHAH